MSVSNSDHGRDVLMVSHVDERGDIVSDLCVNMTGDIETVGGRELMVQAIRHRLITRKGELASLGHPEYGSLLEEMIGEPNVPDTHRIIETFVRDSLKYEPRIRNISSIIASPSPEKPDVVLISVHVELVGEGDELRISYPLYLEG